MTDMTDTTRQPGILRGWSGRAYIINVQKHAQDTSFLTFLLYWLTFSRVRAANIVRRPCSDSSRVTAPYKSSFFIIIIVPSTASLCPTYSRVSPVFPTWHLDDGCGLLPHIVWTFRPFVSLQSAGGRFRFLRLERPASPRRICAVTRGFQTTRNLFVFPFLPRLLCDKNLIALAVFYAIY